MPNVSESEILAYVDAVPSFPPFAKEVIDAVNDESVSMFDMADRIQKDAILAGRVVATSNVVANRLTAGRICTSVKEAVSMLGAYHVLDIVLYVLVRDAFEDNAVLSGGHFWDHATLVSIGARVIAKKCDIDPYACLIAGLMHDAGQLWLHRRYPEQFRQALERSNQGIDITVAESEIFSVDHAFVGRTLAESWGLPAIVTDGITGHHAPSQGKSLVAHVVHLAEVLSAALKYGGDIEPIPNLDPLTLPALRLSPLNLALILGEIEARFLSKQEIE